MAKGLRQLFTAVFLVLAVTILVTIYSTPKLQGTGGYIHEWIHRDAETIFSSGGGGSEAEAEVMLQQQEQHQQQQQQSPDTAPAQPNQLGTQQRVPTPEIAYTHREIFSHTNPPGRYYPINFTANREGINPSLIPHPQFPNTWILIAQQQKSDVQRSVWFAELVCDAVFDHAAGEVRCKAPPLTLPIARTKGAGKCVGELEHFSWSIGPHDARVAYGPNGPYTVFGGQSRYTCFGQYMQDFRGLVDWGRVERSDTSMGEGNKALDFWHAIDLQRPGQYGMVEKNWFPFWDAQGMMYLHYDIYPRRSFAQVLDSEGNAGGDLAVYTAAHDEACLKRYIPELPEKDESVHQATNSLLVTLCKRSEAGCVPNEANTFVMMIIQHKRFKNLHSTYEPYVVLFQQKAPFALHAISQKPLWIHGRKVVGERPKAVKENFFGKGWDQSEMVYVTSINWKGDGKGDGDGGSGNRWHGCADDVLLLGFGIEDERSAVLDVAVGELLAGLGVCGNEAGDEVMDALDGFGGGGGGGFG